METSAMILHVAQVEPQMRAWRKRAGRNFDGFRVRGRAGEILHARIRRLAPGDQPVELRGLRSAAVGLEADGPILVERLVYSRNRRFLALGQGARSGLGRLAKDNERGSVWIEMQRALSFAHRRWNMPPAASGRSPHPKAPALCRPRGRSRSHLPRGRCDCRQNRRSPSSSLRCTNIRFASGSGLVYSKSRGTPSAASASSAVMPM